MEFEGVVYKIMPVTQGTSARGRMAASGRCLRLQRRRAVLPQNLCDVFNKESDVAKLREGETFLVSVNIESREYNGRWYTDIRAWRVQPNSSNRRFR